MQVSVKNIRQILLRVVFRSKVTFFFRTIRSHAIARVVDPAHDVIKISLLTDFLKVCGEITARGARTLADRVAGHTTSSFKQLFSVAGISAWLRWQSVRETVLPQICGDRLDLIARVFVAHVRTFVSVRGETPERRHLGTRSKCLWILEPNR